MDKETIIKQSKSDKEVNTTSNKKNNGDYIEMSRIKDYILKDIKK